MRLANALLALMLPAETAEIVAGDLEEIYRADVLPHRHPAAARWWYWRQVLSIVTAHLLSARERRPRMPHSRESRMASFRQDLSYALRQLRTQPGFTAVAVLTLGLGIGANVAIFSVVHAILYKRLPFDAPHRLMAVHMLAPERDAPGVLRSTVWSYPKYQLFREQQRVFAATAIFRGAEWNLTGTNAPERLLGELVEGSYFSLLGAAPVLGRTFTVDETPKPGAPRLAVLGHGLWMRRYGGDPSVIGQSIGLSGLPYTVVGVLPPGFRGLSGQAEVFVPVMTLDPADLNEAWSHSYRLIARLREDTSPAQVAAAAPLLSAAISTQFPVLTGPAWSIGAVPLDDERAAPVIRRLGLLLQVAAGMLLLIVCVNLANLMVGRGLARQRDTAIRMALGASRLRIVRQLMAESLTLAMGGVVCGLAIGVAVLSTAGTLMPDLGILLRGDRAGLVHVAIASVGLDSATLVFAVGVAVAAALLFGFLRAWQASRRDLTSTIKVGTPAASGFTLRGSIARGLLVAGEMALALTLLVAAGLMLKSVVRLQATELGFRPDSVVSFRLALPSEDYDGPRAARFFGSLTERLEQRADIAAAGWANCAPVSGRCNTTLATFPDRPPVARGSEPPVGVYFITPGYFDALGIPLLRGRHFTETDRSDRPKAVIISEAAARAFWKNEDPIGKRIGLGQRGFSDGAEVIGVVGDVHYGDLENAVRPDAYISINQSPRWFGYVFVKTSAPVASIVPSLRHEVQALDADLPIVEVRTMSDRLGDAIWRPRLSAWLLGTFALLALILGVVGIYGVMTQGVEQRQREIGVRVALGAARRDILRLILGRALIIGVSGVMAGIALSLLAGRALGSLLYDVRPSDPAVLGPLAAVLLAAAILASYIPARRATRVDPLVTLRAE